MTPFNWIKWAPWIACAALSVALAGMGNLYLGKRDELASWKATVATLGRAAEQRVAAVKKEGEDNLQKVKADHEASIPTVRSGAVAAYRMRNPVAGRGTVPGNAAGIKVDDGSGAQRVPDETFIADAAEDAAKVEAWRAWCQLNQCPVE